ncbi:multidrug effflux MFS transporter [Rhodovulum sulfidophilum]|uniref:multidrug effflux MFS transporter n=1 Tax=Rhodovulum sulfidophilum TaxID=35806 RepID=UPI001924888A|nr:multidrug effflux MFS transporter [Rhodovulum sulfidophilum]MBL3594047.1 multidrug effflux MFS transporter [Rhodovulum sulfidophilum]
MAARRLMRVEFVAMTALLFATVAFSIDAMLPALPEIGAELTPDNLNQAQFVVTSFMLGMGAGTLIMGPLSDCFGRKPVILGTAAAYMLGAAIAGLGQSLEWLLIGRVIQGFGAAGVRVVALAVVRDLYSGRDMAKIVSFVMTIFTILPALAPSVGAVVMAGFGWRGIFGSFLVFSLVSMGWFAFRQAETLPQENRRPMRPGPLLAAAREVVASPVARNATLVQTFIFAGFFGFLTSTQQIYDIYFDRADSFPLWFGVVALCAGSASFLNAMLVGRLGMRFMIRSALIGQFMLSGLMMAAFWLHLLPGWAEFPAFVLWSITFFGMNALTIGNLNALAMEPLGHVAGMAASIIGAFATGVSALLAAPIGLLFDGTPRPLAIGCFLSVGVALAVMLAVPRR